nr:MAG TPA: hypothetical protein [Caudoviricetes sp.]
MLYVCFFIGFGIIYLLLIGCDVAFVNHCKLVILCVYIVL